MQSMAVFSHRNKVPKVFRSFDFILQFIMQKSFFIQDGIQDSRFRTILKPGLYLWPVGESVIILGSGCQATHGLSRDKLNFSCANIVFYRLLSDSHSSPIHAICKTRGWKTNETEDVKDNRHKTRLQTPAIHSVDVQERVLSATNIPTNRSSQIYRSLWKRRVVSVAMDTELSLSLPALLGSVFEEWMSPKSPNNCRKSRSPTSLPRGNKVGSRRNWSVSSYRVMG